MPIFRVGFVSVVHAVPPLSMPKAGQICRLSDGRMGVLQAIEGASARVRIFDTKSRNALDVNEPLLDLRSFAPVTPTPVDAHRSPVFQQQAEQFFRNDTLGFPKMVKHFNDFEAISLGKPWSFYTGFAHTVGKHNEVILAAPNMKEQDAFYVRHGFCPVDGRPTGTMVEAQEGLTKILVFAHPENLEKPRHVGIQGKDGLWDVKLGQGPHIKMVDPTILCGGDAGVLARLYVKPPRH